MLVYQTKDGHKHQKQPMCQSNSLKDSLLSASRAQFTDELFFPFSLGFQGMGVMQK